MKLVYPIILYPMEEHEGGYTVEVPDLPGCVTEGHDLADALDMARDAASGWILDEMEDGRAVPHASNITDVKPDEPDGIVSLISLDMDAYAEKYGSKAVRKNGVKVVTVAPFASNGAVKLNAELVATVPGAEAEALNGITADADTIVLIGDRAAGIAHDRRQRAVVGRVEPAIDADIECSIRDAAIGMAG